MPFRTLVEQVIFLSPVFTMAPIALSESPPPARAVQPATNVNLYKGYAYVHWYVGNAKQAASYYVTRMGFQRVAYRGLETGSRALASHVVSNGNVTFVITSPLRDAGYQKNLSKSDRALLQEIHHHQETHGDGVKGKTSTYLASGVAIGSNS